MAGHNPGLAETEFTTLQRAAFEGNIKNVSRILSNGVRFDLSATVGSPVQLAVSQGHHNIAKILRLEYLKVSILDLSLQELQEMQQVLCMNKRLLSNYSEETTQIASSNELKKKPGDKKDRTQLKKESKGFKGDVTTLEMQAVNDSYLMFQSAEDVDRQLNIIKRRIGALEDHE